MPYTMVEPKASRPYVAPSTRPLASCCRNWVTKPSRHEEGAGCPAPSSCRQSMSWLEASPSASDLALEGPGLLGLPSARRDLVDGERLVRGVAVLVEGHLAGRAGDRAVLHRLDHVFADRVVDRALVRQHLGQHGDDHIGGVVGVRAVGTERLG